MTVNDEICAYHVLEPTPSDVASSRRIASHGINAILAGLHVQAVSHVQDCLTCGVSIYQYINGRLTHKSAVSTYHRIRPMTSHKYAQHWLLLPS